MNFKLKKLVPQLLTLLVVIIVLNAIIFSLAARENLEEYKNSLSNISNIDTIKE